MIEVKGLYKDFGSLHVLRGVSLNVEQGDIISIIGPYGSGNRIPMKKEDIVRMVTGTGGGYGDPLEREEARVAMDVKNEYITADDAREIYGVEVDPVTFAVTGLTAARKAHQTVRS